MKKTTQLRKIIESTDLAFIMEAHNGLSAKIVEEAGFKGIWASGLTISAALGVRDNNEASWTQILEVLEFMSDNTSIPILVDGDTGYGNFNNVRRLVHKLEQRDIAGVCLEDKLFPKTNSFISGETQPLADMDEFCGKIRAAKDAQQDPDFIVIARVEAFIAGWGLEEAIRRAKAYKQAGADAILIHSKKSNDSEIESFMRAWGNQLPVIIVPTKYYSTPTDKFRDMGVSLVIWANHNLRAGIISMQKISQKIFNDETLTNVEDQIVPVAEIFRLQNSEELQEAEKKYLPTANNKTSAIILAAAKGEELGELTSNMPKTLLQIGNKTLLSQLVGSFNRVGIKDISVVRGFAKEKIQLPNIKVVDNDHYADTTELGSLLLAKDEIKENTIICYGDIMFKSYLLNDLLNDSNDITLVVDADYGYNDNRYHEYVKTDTAYSRKLYSRTVKLEKIFSTTESELICGEFIGLFKVNDIGGQVVKKTLEEMSKLPNFSELRMESLFAKIIKSHPIAVRFINGDWLDINTIIDLQKTESFQHA